MIFEHKSVLLYETVDSLNIKPDGIYVDGTLGGGGHALPDQLSGHRLAGEGHAQLPPDSLRQAAPGLAGLAHAFRSGPDPA